MRHDYSPENPGAGWVAVIAAGLFIGAFALAVIGMVTAVVRFIVWAVTGA